MKKADRKTRPGPAGMLIVEQGFRLGGARRGQAKRRTKRQLAALREGRSMKKADREAIEAAGPNAPAVRDAYRATQAGDFAPLASLNLDRAARASSLLFDRALDAVEKSGSPISSEVVYGSDGKIVASRQRLHVGAELALRAAETFGISADAQGLTPRARAATKKDEGIGDFLARQAKARASLEAHNAGLAAQATAEATATEGEIVEGEIVGQGGNEGGDEGEAGQAGEEMES